MKRSRVLVSTFVFVPLMIGGNERTTPFESKSIGYALVSASMCPYARPISVSLSISPTVIWSSEPSGVNEKFSSFAL